MPEERDRLFVSCWIIFFIIGLYGFQYPVDAGTIVKRCVIKKFQVRHVSKPKLSGQFSFDKSFGALKTGQNGLVIMFTAMGGKVNLGNPKIPAHGHAGNRGLGQSRVIDAFADQSGQHFVHLAADSFGSAK